MKSFFTIVPFFVVFLSACTTTNLFVDTAKTNDSVDVLVQQEFGKEHTEYRIRKDDKITISLWGQDEMSVGSTYGIYNSNEVYGKWLMVDQEGKIELPVVNSFHVESMTLIQLKDTLRKLYSEKVKDPVVDVKVLNREITVLGEVRDPQVILVDKEQNNLLELIARCKGLEFYANAKQIKVFRQVGKDVYVTTIDLTRSGDFRKQNINLYPGDIVIVPSKNYKEFDRRISTIIPFTSTLTAVAIFMGMF